MGIGALVAGDVGRRWSSGRLGTPNRLHNLLLTSVAVLATGAPANAADWLGGTSSDWFVPGNWNPAAVPGSATGVTINNGGTPNPANITAAGAQAQSVDIGTAGGQSGTLNVNGGALAIGTSLQAGNNGSGTVNITSGGTVNAGSAFMAVNPNSSGTITVSGAGSKLTATQTYIGMDAGAIGQMTVQNGANLTSGTTVVGYFSATANGTLTVSGSTFTNTGSFTIGERGVGTFNLNSGSTAATSSFVFIGSNATGNGTANISDSGTTWTTGNMNVGSSGTGTMTISNGAHVTSNRTFSATPVASIGGSATVTGSGSQWLIDGRQTGGSQAALGIGKTNSTSSLTVSAGGTLRINNNATGTDGQFSDTRIAVSSGSTANVTITGANSSMTTPYNTYVGYGTNSTGNVTVSNGGALNTGHTELGSGTGATGSVTVTGAGSTWTVSDSQNVPGGQAQGLSVGLGSATSVGTLTIADGGTVNVNSTGRTVNLGGLAGSQATLNIGAAAASPAAAAGTLNADTVVFVTGATSTINFNHTSSSYIFAPAIQGTGPGTVNFLAGTTILTGNNTYAGTTNIASGATAQLGNGGNAGGSNGLVSGNIANNGALIFKTGAFSTYGGVISGNGTVEQRGSTTLTLTGNNTYAGLTTISSGTLQIGNGGTTGSIAGDVLNNSQIIFNRSNNFSFNNVISGTGSLTKSGTGIMTLGNVNTYTGGTSVQQGTLRLGGNDRIASTSNLFLFSTGTFDLAGFNQTVGDLSGPGTVAIGAGTFTAGTANDRTFAGSLTGSGAFIKQGTGSLNLTGNNAAYTGTTTVNAGTLSVNGNLSGSAVTVNAGATLGGSGTVGTTMVNGNIAPGNSIGTLNVAGPYVQAAGSTYTVEVNPAGQSDLISVTGTATIQAGAGVNVVGAPGFYTLGQRYTILTATGGVTGQYTTLTDNLPFVDFTLDSNANNIFLDVTRSSVSFQEIAQTRNQRAAASGAEALGTGSKIFDSVVMLDAPNARRAFDLLSGEIHASVTGTVLEDSRFIRDAVNGRLRQSIGGTASIFAPQFAALSFGETTDDVDALAYAPAKRKQIRDTMDRALPLKAAPLHSAPVFTAWGQAFGNFGRTDGDGNAATLHRTTGGFITGMDVTMPGSIGDVWRAGLAGGYQHTSVDVGDRSSSGSIDAYYLAAYGGRQIGALGLRAGASYGWHDVSTSRNVVFPGFSDATKGKYGANTAQLFGEIGYGVTWRQFAFEPFAGLAYVNLHTDSFVEAGGAAALAGSGGTTDTTYSTVGLRAATPLPWRNLAGLVAKSSVGWRHAFGAVTPTAQLGFASGTTPFVVAGVPIARDAASVELGLEGRVWRGATLGLVYTGQIAGQADDHGVNASFVQRF